MPSRPPIHRPQPRAREVQVQRQVDDRVRGTATKRGYSSKWSRAAKGYIAKHPLCVECQRQGRVTLSAEADHIIPHRYGEAMDSGDQDAIDRARHLLWDFDRNVQALCKSCHSRKTVQEDGGFGNRRANANESHLGGAGLNVDG